MRDDGRGAAGDDAAHERDAELRVGRELRALVAEHGRDETEIEGVGDEREDRQLRDGVRQLLEQQGRQAAIEAHDALGALDGSHAAERRAILGRSGHHANAQRLERSQESGGGRLGDGARRHVGQERMRVHVLGAKDIDELVLAKVEAAKLEHALHKVPDQRRSEAQQQTALAVGTKHITERIAHALVLSTLQLHTGLDDIDRYQDGMRYRSTQTTS